LGFGGKGMRLVSPILRHVVYPGLSKVGYLRRATGDGPVVLTYHGVLPSRYKPVDPILDGNLVTASQFRDQLRFIKDQYNVLLPDEFLLWCRGELELPPRSLLITCDDGLQNCLVEMTPALREFELECLFFVTGASLSHTPTMLWYEELYLMLLAASDISTVELPEVGFRVDAGQQSKHSLWLQLVRKLSQFDLSRRRMMLDEIRTQLPLTEGWDAQYRENAVLSRRFLLLNRRELHELANSGMSIGAHSLSHPALSQASSDVAWKEICESKRNLEATLGKKIWAFAYPFGDSSSVTSREVRMAGEAGFDAAFFNEEGVCADQHSRLTLPRVHVTGGMSLAELEARLSGVHRSLQWLFRPHSAGVGANA
jgi:peptidoglycan/xylan/chitin deacetylase (PgdA/CDA1 family)